MTPHAEWEVAAFFFRYLCGAASLVAALPPLLGLVALGMSAPGLLCKSSPGLLRWRRLAVLAALVPQGGVGFFMVFVYTFGFDAGAGFWVSLSRQAAHCSRDLFRCRTVCLRPSSPFFGSAGPGACVPEERRRAAIPGPDFSVCRSLLSVRRVKWEARQRSDCPGCRASNRRFTVGANPFRSAGGYLGCDFCSGLRALKQGLDQTSVDLDRCSGDVGCLL